MPFLNVASLLLIISDPGEQAVCVVTLQQEAGARDEILADANKMKATSTAKR